jgi:hypothetical protein
MYDEIGFSDFVRFDMLEMGLLRYLTIRVRSTLGLVRSSRIQQI